MPITAPMPKIQNAMPTPTKPPGPGLVATNTQPLISATMMPSSAIELGENGRFGLLLDERRAPAAPSRPSAPTKHRDRRDDAARRPRRRVVLAGRAFPLVGVVARCPWCGTRSDAGRATCRPSRTRSSSAGPSRSLPSLPVLASQSEENAAKISQRRPRHDAARSRAAGLRGLAAGWSPSSSLMGHLGWASPYPSRRTRDVRRPTDPRRSCARPARAAITAARTTAFLM